MAANDTMSGDKADEGLAAPSPGSTSTEGDATKPEIRDAMDAESVDALNENPSDEDAKLDVALDETFPTSDAPSNTQPGKGKDPAPSSGYDAEAEAARAGKE